MANYKFGKLSESVSHVYMKGLDNCSLHISTTNSKLGCIPSFNLLPGITCSKESCGHCLREGCYAVKNAFRAGYDVEKNGVLRSWAENTTLALHDLARLEDDLVEYFTRARHVVKLFRIHSSGDFFSDSYADMWYRIARQFPEIRFLAFTKQWDVVRVIPFYQLPNFSLVLSGWTGIESRIPEDAMQCPGNCETCGMCWYLNELGRDTKFEKH